MGESRKQYDEALVNFYEEQLVARADTVYRFAFALTLSLDGASKHVAKAYREIAATLETVYAGGAGEANATSVLLGACWRAHQEAKGQSYSEGQSAVTKALRPIEIEARAALGAVDIAGLSPADAAKTLGWPETTLRSKLAAARRALMMSNLDV